MPLIVQKFGGTSVADSQKILAAARKAVRAQQAGNQVVVVVSAMGKNTDMLVDLASEICEHPPAREMDMLLSTGEQVSVALMAMAIHSLGHQAVSLTGAQIGIRTDSTHTKARIQSISTERMQASLDAGQIVIAAGFQGIDENFNITTLGRGGSDTSAVSLAAVLNADACEIYTDVDGVYTTDPRLLPEARQVHQVSYDEMLELASLGAGVMHSRSIEFAKKFGVPIHVRNSASDAPGTVIGPLPEASGRVVSGAALTKNEARVTIADVPDRPGVSLAVFAQLANRAIPVDMIVQNVGAEGRANISFTVLESELEQTIQALEEVLSEFGGAHLSSDSSVSKVSVVGLGMAEQTGVADKMFRALADAGVNILMITTSEIKISCLVASSQAQTALAAVHRAFMLHEEPADLIGVAEHQSAPRADAADVVARLQGLEDLAVDGISLDASQARVTIDRVPDHPGIAAEVFEGVSSAGVFVDMIVQSDGSDGHTSLSFTVPGEDLDQAVQAAEKLCQAMSAERVSSDAQVAKLSVSGIGLRSHTGVAIRMFEALSAEGINIELINTSEVCVNVIVAGGKGDRALAALEAAFADVRR